MKQIVVPLCVFGLATALFAGIGGFSQARAAYEITNGELNFWGDWSINPSKIEYTTYGVAEIQVTVSNVSDKESQFDLGDGDVVSIPAHGNASHTYLVYLRGQTERITITNLEINLGGQFGRINAQNLKIEPK